MSDERIPILLTRVQILELCCLLNSMSLRADAAPRFKRIVETLMNQACEQSTMEQLEETMQDATNLMDSNYFPEIINAE